MTEWAVIALESVARGRKDDDLVSRERLSEMDTRSRYLAACAAVGREEDLVSDILALVKILQGRRGRERLIRKQSCWS
jgi:hypothetical protein